ncbi:EPSP synthase-domain-containing protein [Zopfochytrium polystomum]|nr:EPSP synthase-domain-containing protein [Zopfochytrium polystomum]
MYKVSILGAETITVGFDITAHIAGDVVGSVPASSYVLVADSNVAAIHLSALHAAFVTAAPASSRVLTFVVPPGEAAKTRATKESIEDWMLASSCTRDSCIVALGGGVVGDMFGFVAATFMRGVPVIQVPTTLLAMVDSSIGGKTAVDTPHGKNLIGAFHQPRHIFMDLKYLTTLPHREFLNGLAEVIKTAAIWDADDFTVLESSVEQILALSAANVKPGQLPDHTLLMRVVLGSVRVKAHVVTIDEKETGLRGLLNFGHSVGHAIEAILSPELLHGECIAMGMMKEIEIARNLGHVNDVDVGRLARCLQAYGLPLSVDDKKVRQLAPSKFCPVDKLLDIMRVDKKNQGNRKRIVLLATIGQTVEPKASFVDDVVIRKILSPAMEVIPVPPTANAKPISLSVPGSKSLSNRALVLAALGEGTCRLKGLLHSDDVQVMLDALNKLVGITYSWEDRGQTLVVQGGAGRLQVPREEIYLGNAGTAARFLTTVCSLVRQPAQERPATIVTGNARMKQRPIAHLVDALRQNGCQIEYLESQGCLPLRITPNGSGVRGGLIRLAASISSQYVSSILLSAPYAEQPVTLELVGDAVVSQPYIDMTIAMMESFGIHVERDSAAPNTYRIPVGVYKNPAVYEVEADASSATYPLAFAAITGRQVTVTNMGSASLQGDAAFAVKVLGAMGCEVTQTPTQTTVRGPAVLKPIPHIDMESMTDAFLTASVLAAVATGTGGGEDQHTTRITGIANQRVKECNRIAAMVEQLARFGVRAGELPDGIEVHGSAQGKAALRAPESGQGVKCYDDHRIAMSFSVLACAMPGSERAVVNEKKCVEKTWPSWWDVLERELGVQLRGVDSGPHSPAPSTGPASTTSAATAAGTGLDADEVALLADDTIVIIGMRGAGKTNMGRSAAAALGRTFIDMDDVLEAGEGQKIPAFLAQHGWEVFREREAAHLRAVLASHATGHVVSCGGGIVETEAGRNVLAEWVRGGGSGSRRHVVHVQRDIEEIVAYLLRDATRPVYGEDTRAVFNRRLPLYRACSTAEFLSVRGDPSGPRGAWAPAQEEFARFLRFHLRREPLRTPAGAAGGGGAASAQYLSSSFFVALTLPDLRDALGTITSAAEGSDAIELRVDLLQEQSDDFLLAQIAAIRRATRGALPIIFTVRTKGQAGRWPDEDEEGMFALLRKAVKWGCEFIDVEVDGIERSARRELTEALVRGKGNSHLIASYHDITGTAVWVPTNLQGGLAQPTAGADGALRTPVMMKAKYAECSRFGDSVKLIGKANHLGDNFALQQFVWSLTHGATTGGSVKPLIAMNMGAVGQLSRVLNTYLTPVTHPSLPVAAAPGQLSVAEIHRARHLLGLVPAREYFLFGHPIGSSPSPSLHNAGFAALGLPHGYALSEGADAAHVAAVVEGSVRAGRFGGASVTIPHKEAFAPGGALHHLLSGGLTAAASRIGAVNTLVMAGADAGAGSIVGDNTDWLGIRAGVLRGLGVRASLGEVGAGVSTVGVVIGAGGTARAACYALRELGVGELRVWNRTAARAAAVAGEFGGVGVSRLDELAAAPNGGVGGGQVVAWVVVSVIPGAAQGELDVAGLFDGFERASGAGSVGVVVELAYRPRETAVVVGAAAGQGSGTTRSMVQWRVVHGLDVLVEQGLAQFERWTGRRAPRAAMEAAATEFYYRR